LKVNFELTTIVGNQPRKGKKGKFPGTGGTLFIGLETLPRKAKEGRLLRG